MSCWSSRKKSYAGAIIDSTTFALNLFGRRGSVGTLDSKVSRAHSNGSQQQGQTNGVSDRRTLGFPRDPISWDSTSQNILEGTKIKNRSTLHALGSNKNDDEEPFREISL